MRELRAAWGVPVGLPATRWMAEVGALAIPADTELLLEPASRPGPAHRSGIRVPAGHVAGGRPRPGPARESP